MRSYYRQPAARARKQAYMAEYNNRPEVKARREEYNRRPEVKARNAEHYRRYRRRKIHDSE